MRGRCRYRLFDLEAMPKAHRRAALALQLRQWSPFARSAAYVVWREGKAMAWVWDATALPGEASTGEIVPEPLWYAPPERDGARLLRCRDGVEAQYWLAGVLHASRWWPQAPAAAEWRAFQRDAAVPADAQTVDVSLQVPSLLDRPFAPNAVADSGSRDELIESLAYAAAALLLGWASVWYGAEHIKLQRAQAHVEKQAAGLNGASNRLAQARRRAIEAQTRLNDLDRLSPYPSQLTIYDAITQAMPAHLALTLTEWNYHTGKLKFSVLSPTEKLSSTDLVAAFGKNPIFSDVKVITDANPRAMGVQMNVEPRIAAAPTVHEGGA